MSRTVSYHWPRSRLGEYTAKCSYCGAAWSSGSLRRDRSGNYACPDEGPGADAVTCSELNAAGARGANRRRRPMLAPVSSAEAEPNPVNLVTTATNELWLRPDLNLVASDGFVDSWADGSGSGRAVASQLTARPSLTLSDATANGAPVVTWDGVNDYLEAASGFAWETLASADYYVFMVVRLNAWALARRLFETGVTNGAGIKCLMITTSPTVGYAAGGVGSRGAPMYVGRWGCLEMGFSADPNRCFISAFGQETGVASLGTGEVAKNLVLGKRQDGVLFASMSLADLAMYRGIPDIKERALLRDMYAQRYL